MREDRLRLVGIAGSLRVSSYNRQLLREAKRIAPENVEVVERDIGLLPLYNEDLERDSFPPPARALGNALREADGLLIATPEYNYGIPGVLKNAMDWMSRPADDSPLEGLPTAIIGASQGMGGTARAQLALRDAFVFTRTPVLTGPEVLVARCADQFAEDGRLKDRETERFLADLLERFEVFMRRLAREPVARPTDRPNLRCHLRDGTRRGHRSATDERPFMEQDAGWVVVLDVGSNVELARAHLIVEAAETDGEWSGYLDSVRLTSDTSELLTGQYAVRFEAGAEVRLVDITAAEAPLVQGADGTLPAALLERSSGE